MVLHLNPTLEVITASIPNYTKASEAYKLHPLARSFKIPFTLNISDKTLQDRVLIFIQLAVFNKLDSVIEKINSADILVPIQLQRPQYVYHLKNYSRVSVTDFNPDGISFRLRPLKCNYNFVSLGIFDKSVHGTVFDVSFIVTEETIKLINDGQQLMVYIATDDLGKGVCFANPSKPLHSRKFTLNESLILNSTEIIDVSFKLNIDSQGISV